MPFAPIATPHHVTVYSFGDEAIGVTPPSLLGSLTSTAWPAANRAHYVPFVINDPFIVYKLGWFNGGSVAGNVDMGIFSENGVKLTSTGATGQSGTNTYQVVTLGAAVTLPPGRYYLGLSCSSGSARIFCQAFTSEAGRAYGCAQEASAHPLPSSFTLAAAASGYVLPNMFALGRSAA